MNFSKKRDFLPRMKVYLFKLSSISNSIKQTSRRSISVDVDRELAGVYLALKEALPGFEDCLNVLKKEEDHFGLRNCEEMIRIVKNVDEKSNGENKREHGGIEAHVSVTNGCLKQSSVQDKSEEEKAPVPKESVSGEKVKPNRTRDKEAANDINIEKETRVTEPTAVANIVSSGEGVTRRSRKDNSAKRKSGARKNFLFAELSSGDELDDETARKLSLRKPANPAQHQEPAELANSVLERVSIRNKHGSTSRNAPKRVLSVDISDPEDLL